MKVIDGNLGIFSGHVGGLIYYVRNGKCYARTMPRRNKKRKPTERQVGLNKRFAAVQRLYRFYREHVSEEIWRLAGRAEGRMAHNLFYSRNYACFDERGELVDPGGFVFSAGVLLPLQAPRVEALGGNRWRVEWLEAEEGGMASATDRLMVGVVRVVRRWDAGRGEERLLCGAYLAGEVTGTRGEGSGEFTVGWHGDNEEVCAFAFFARADGSAFSPSRRVDLPGFGPLAD